jgi:hypothetical protein
MRKRRRKEPRKALRVTTYERLKEYLGASAEGHFHLLILVGSGGLAKSRSVRSVLGGKGCWIEGNATPFGMYAKLYRHRDEFVVIDDVDLLYADRSGRQGPTQARRHAHPRPTQARQQGRGLLHAGRDDRAG